MPFNYEQKTRRAGMAWGGFSWIVGLARVLAGTVMLISLQGSLQALQSVTLGWQQTADPNAVGYNIYYGPATHDYTNMISVGNVTSVTIGGLVEGATYYFAATTYNAQGQESGFSSEVVYVVPIVAATNMVAVVQLRSGSAGQFILTVTGPSGQSYDIQATQDFKAWTVIGTVTVGAGGSLDFTDTNAANFPQRFYRTQETP